MILVSCAIIEKGEQILIAQRSESMSLPLKWEFPGGKLEEGESAEESLVREIREELNLEISIMQRLSKSTHEYSNKRIVLIPFICQIHSGAIELREHKEARWIKIDEIEKYQMAEADIPIANEYRQLKRLNQE